ncbi:MAG: type II toxin-antitoxin system ParD family antitoxin [Caulobacter sp.]|nr:type II toxin-antitoxin system ParD family antitoxin [Caulobacter sp.]
MRTTRQMSITLPVEMADSVRAKVASGDYASESEVIREGLRALEAREEAVERWLRTEVVATCEAFRANPDSGIPAAEVRASIEKLHRERVEAEARRREAALRDPES